MPKSEKFVAVDADLRPGHADFPGARRRGLRERIARSRTPGLVRLTSLQQRALAFTYGAMLFMLVYTGVTGAAIFQPGYRPIDRFASVFLLLGLGFILVHGFGYANSMVKACWSYRDVRTHLFAPGNSPSVDCIIACYNEPAEVLEETVGNVVAMEYANKRIVILDDSTKDVARNAAREIAARFGVECIQRTTRRGYKAGAINDYLPKSTAEYLAIFDSDALPVRGFLQEVVPLIDENPKLGFVQTPQYYANTEVSNVAMAATRQQNVFYEYICEGKSYSRAAFCCGTNVIFRRSGLVDSGGFDESNVTEDFATSFNMHIRGWDSLYFNRTYVYSLAPENLAAYFMQQSRWSFGTMGTGRHFIKEFFKGPRRMRLGQWWEYFLSATYYWVGWVNFIFLCLPMIYIFFGIKPLRQDVFTYLAVFVPYFVLTLNMFYTGMEARGFSVGEMILGQQIGFLSFPIHMSSAISGLLGLKRPFGVTPKGVGGRLPWKALWPQILMMVLSGLACVWGTYKYATGIERDTTAVVVNSLWALYHVWMLSSLFRLNQKVREGEKAYFDDPNRESPTKLYPQPVAANVSVGVLARRAGLLVGLGTLGLAGWIGFSVLNWSFNRPVPVNVYILDRTVGRDDLQHRTLTWTLNYLKVRKAPDFGPTGGGGRRTYDWNDDYYGFVPGVDTKLERDQTGEGDWLAYGKDRPLPDRLTPPGVLYLADTFGEFVDYEPTLNSYVHFRDEIRGLTPDEVDHISSFSQQNGLVIGEWNILGYPTRPGNFVPENQLELSRTGLQQKASLLQWRDNVDAKRQFNVALYAGDAAGLARARDRLLLIRNLQISTAAELRSLQYEIDSSARDSDQNAAADRLQNLFHVNETGWYGCYVDDFAEQREYDYPLWKNVRDYLTRKYGVPTDPSGPGFVFYPQGPSRIYDEKSGSLVDNPFAKPIAILGSELGSTTTTSLALICRTHRPGVADDPLLRGVVSSVPSRLWFDVTLDQPGARVLAYYKLHITPEAASRLKAAGFPSACLTPAGTYVVFPAAISWRDGGTSTGELRSLYLAGDAGDFPLASPLTEHFPALGGIASALEQHFGSYSSEYYWGYYEPLMRNAIGGTPRVRYQP